MADTEALVLDNWYPRTGFVVTRDGSLQWVTGPSGTGKTLIPYHGLSTAKLFLATTTGIFDVTTSGTVSSAVYSSAIDPQLQYTQFATSAGHYLYAVNGREGPFLYDGTNWTVVTGTSTPALTGPGNLPDLIGVVGYKRRLFFWEKDKLSFWYLAGDSIGGTLTEYHLGPLASRGGYLVSMATWTIDGGSGPDDYLLAVTSMGEILVFTGTDPGTVGFWAIVGIYFLAKPLGRKCCIKYGGDVVILTELGAFQISTALKPAGKLALSSKIDRAFIEAARDYRNSPGWTGCIYPSQNALIINIPQASGTSVQYVMNTLTKAWCRFTGWSTADMVEFEGSLYFIKENSANVHQAWTGFGDNGASATFRALPAYSYFGTRGQTKKIQLFQPVFRLQQVVDLSYGVNTDFIRGGTTATTQLGLLQGSLWGTAVWGTDVWGGEGTVNATWLTPLANPGFAHSLEFSITAQLLPVEWLSTNIIVEDETLL
jgi:hypothetical protein